MKGNGNRSSYWVGGLWIPDQARQGMTLSSSTRSTAVKAFAIGAVEMSEQVLLHGC
jgi:hypothetical protein